MGVPGGLWGNENDAQASSFHSWVESGTITKRGTQEEKWIWQVGGVSFLGDSPTMRSLWIARRSARWVGVCGSLEYSEGCRLG